MTTIHTDSERYRKIATKQPGGFLQGIYFDMDNETYHADPAFSHSGMVDILKHPYFYWISSPLNPQRERRAQTEAMRLGELIHQKLLEPKKFDALYRMPTDGWCRDKVILTTNMYQSITRAVDELGDTKDLYFSDGMPEVSVFWLDPLTGMRLKCRFDWLKTYGAVDRKNAREITDQEIGNAICNFGYDIQEELYVEGMRNIKRLLREGTCRVVGEHDPEWLQRFIDEPACGFCFLFQRSQWPFVYQYVQLPSDVLDNARRCIDDAKQCYLDNLEAHGTKHWPAGDAIPKKLATTDIPMRIYNRGYRGKS